MSTILNNALEYVEQSKSSLLVTLGEDNIPFVRPIGAFSNDGANIYFLTAKITEKVKHIRKNPTVTFYFRNDGQPIQTFKSVALTGEASEVTEDLEFEKAVEAISLRYPVIKEKAATGEIKNSSIYKVNTKLVKFVDYTQTPREVTVNI